MLLQLELLLKLVNAVDLFLQFSFHGGHFGLDLGSDTWRGDGAGRSWLVSEGDPSLSLLGWFGTSR